MATTTPLMDQVIFDSVEQAEELVENSLNSDVMYYYGKPRTSYTPWFRDAIEKVSERKAKEIRLRFV
ncbi:MAG: hypothetical protein JSC189_000910 [Candidatus Tokpelaia sp. JSC189]|nr:MAG: hypothetical protein JSC189_000910 [Candidatus Tokpelaia sp. JSC189]